MHAADASRSTLLVGMGNSLRGDDSAGIGIAEALARRQLPDVRVLTGLDEGLSLINAWENARNVYIFDAVHSGSPTGQIHRIDARDTALPDALFNASTHSFSVAQAVELARVLDRLPARLIIYGVEGNSFGHGAPVTPAVREAMDQVIEDVTVELSIGADEYRGRD